jgi:uncharacterized protein (TIGR02145 family)
MKKILTLSGLAMLTISVFAQSPEKISYQAVIRNTGGELVASHAVGVLISILHDSPTGDLIYTEAQTSSTNENGLLSIEIGSLVSLAGIDWSDGPYYIKTDIDPAGGTSYTITGTSQLLSVPYALHANTASGYTETDPLFATSSANGIAAANINNWNTAYDWGDHSEAGYSLTGHTHSANDVGAVGLTGDQTITGIKTFTGTVSVPTPVNDQDAVTKEYVDALQNQITALENKLISGGLLLKDADGNIYSYINIGTRTWMVENLRTTKYNDGTEIPLVTNMTDWGHISTPGYCWFNNNEDTYGSVYGVLYNWFAISTTTNGGKNVCPTGWHVPTHAEWTALETYLIANGYNYDGTTTGNKIAKSMAATTNWTSSGITGVPGNTDYPGKRNILGFTGLPGGFRNAAGGFFQINNYGIWWSSVVHDTDPSKSWARGINHDVVELIEYADNKKSGFSVRCLKD